MHTILNAYATRKKKHYPDHKLGMPCSGYEASNFDLNNNLYSFDPVTESGYE